MFDKNCIQDCFLRRKAGKQEGLWEHVTIIYCC